RPTASRSASRSSVGGSTSGCDRTIGNRAQPQTVSSTTATSEPTRAFSITACSLPRAHGPVPPPPSLDSAPLGVVRTLPREDDDMSIWLTPEQLARTRPAERTDFATPVPTRVVSNGEWVPPPQSRGQKR